MISIKQVRRRVMGQPKLTWPILVVKHLVPLDLLVDLIVNESNSVGKEFTKLLERK